MYFFITVFLSFLNLTINKCTSYIIVLQCWHTAARKHPTERENGPSYKKVSKTTDIDGKDLMVVRRAVW